MTKTINLSFGPNTYGLAGVTEGKETFKKQVEPLITQEMLNSTAPITIQFPDSIVIIGISFWDGFSEELINTVGYDGIAERIHFVTSSERLTQELYDYMI
ncbi:hypothetical protein [Fructobacillus durionis]|uniref:DUF4325 domain-containing protein n=1 Tax=Fructobacillus durionis TaxID=283737 RepID=A0A1I1GWI0_9LACO|nr:hypothetical protein [Fructobacillus durionis]SFC15911.1 hypothetical protein SAMN05660453_1211 [Fructobacillus durionis]